MAFVPKALKISPSSLLLSTLPQVTRGESYTLCVYISRAWGVDMFILLRYGHSLELRFSLPFQRLDLAISWGRKMPMLLSDWRRGV